jgi:hypothetical protein
MADDETPVTEAPEPVKVVQYRALAGITFGKTFVAPGEVSSDIPAKSVKWLLAQKYIEEVN